MRRFLSFSLLFFTLHSSLFIFAEGVTQYVNPFMGTTTLWTPEDLGFVPKPGERQWGAETFPGAALPNAMVQLTPVTKYRSGSGYQYEDSLIYGFAHTSKGHWNLLHVPILPVTEEGNPTPLSYASHYSHDNEEAHPGYYRVFLDRYNVNVELTTTLRCGYHRYTFDNSKFKIQNSKSKRGILIDIARSNNMPRRWELKQVGTHAFEGFQDGEGRIYFYGELSEEIDSLAEEGRWNREEGTRNGGGGRWNRGRNQRSLVGMVWLKEQEVSPQGGIEGAAVELKIGFSFVSVENAKENLRAELDGKSFEEVRNNADKIWNDILGHIQVEGGTEADKKMLYSTFYRTFLFPHLRTDVNGQHLNEIGQVTSGNFNYYTNPSFWDTYRNKLILLGMVTPDVARDIIRSCIERGEARGGYMPTFFHGDHASTFVAGSWLRGIKDFDLKRAYALMLKSATVPGRGGRPYLDEYLERGWISEKDTVNVLTGNEYKGAVTKTVEFAYDDYATALVARELGDKENEQLLLKHSQNYKTLFDPSTGFWRGKVLRDGKGVWIEDFRPDYPYYQYQYREADAWNSLFFAPHDPMGMVALYPSKEAVEQKLDSLFTTPNGGYLAFNCTGYLGKYCHGNQPGHSIPFTYYFIDKQEKAQHVLNTLLHKYYGMGKEGLAYAGMDDAGEMSSWFVLNAIGIYTYSPADPEYIVTVPLFDKVHFTLGNGQSFDIVKEGSGEKIKRITIGGKPLQDWFVKHEDLANGKELKIITE